MFERFTDRSRRTLVLAQDEARSLGHEHIGTEHLLLGLLEEGTGVAARVLTDLGVTLEAARARVPAAPAGGPATVGAPPFTPRAKSVLEYALREALQFGHSYIGTEHLLLGLVREDDGSAARILADLGVPTPTVREAVLGRIDTGVTRPPGSDDAAADALVRAIRGIGERERPGLTPSSLDANARLMALDVTAELRMRWAAVDETVPD